MIIRSGFALLTLCFALQVSADPKDPSLYLYPRVGLVSISDGSHIEGSKKFGGNTPDFLIDWNSPKFSELKKLCRKIKSEKKDPVTATNEIRQYLMKNVFIRDPLSVEYTKIIASHQKDNLARLSEFLEWKSVSCRESAYMLHLAMKEAGIKSKLAYVKIPLIIANSNDHAILIYRQGNKWRSVDAVSDAYKDSELDTLLAQGKIVQLNLFPRVWTPKKNTFIAQLSKFKSVDELKSTLVSIVKRIPDMQEIWKTSVKHQLNLKLGGGIVRGAIRWMIESLETHTLEELSKITPPKSTELLLNPKADRDLYAPKDKILGAKVFTVLREWEISDDSTFEESVSAGGGALDKVRVGIAGIDDPLGALESLIRGDLKYVIKNEDEIKKTFWFKERGNTLTAMALRYIRGTIDFPELSVPKEVEQYLLKISRTEITPRDQNSEAFHWIQKALIKIFEASYEDSVTTALELRKYGFLKPLVEAGYQLPLESSLTPSFEGFGELGWSLSEINDTKKLFNTSFDSMTSIGVAALRATNVEATLRLLRRGVSYAKSADDYIQLFSPRIKLLSLNDEAKETVFLESMESFLKFKPTIEQAVKYMQVIQVTDESDRRLYKKMVTLAHTPDDYIFLFQSISESRSNGFVRAYICLESLDYFFAMNPSTKEVRKLLWSGKFPDESKVDLEILKRAALSAKTLSEYIEIFMPFKEFNSKDFSSYRTKAALASLDHFFKLKPTTENIKNLLALAHFENKVDQEIFIRAEPLFTDRAEFNALLKLYPNVVKPDWTDRCWRKLTGRS